MKKKDLVNANIEMMYLVGIELIHNNSNYLPLQDLHRLLYQNVQILLKKPKKVKR